MRVTLRGRHGRIALGAAIAGTLIGGVVGISAVSGAHPATTNTSTAGNVAAPQLVGTDDPAARAAAARSAAERAAAAAARAREAREKAAGQPGARPRLPAAPRRPGAPAAAPAGPLACTAYAFVAARGTGEPQGDERAVLRPVFDRVAASVPGGVNYNVVYPATTDFSNGPRQGAADINRVLAAQAAACPTQRFVLAGYSQGAMAVAVATQSMPPATRARVAAIVVFGDPYYRPDQPWNATTNAASRGGLAAALNGLSAFPQFPGRIQDYCNANDSVCGSGSGIAGHLTYGRNTAAAANFVVAHLR